MLKNNTEIRNLSKLIEDIQESFNMQIKVVIVFNFDTTCIKNMVSEMLKESGVVNDFEDN